MVAQNDGDGGDYGDDGEDEAGEVVRTFRRVDPESRRVRRRRTARVLLVDDRERLLLFSDSDPGLPGLRWWITPGGGIEPGESDRQGAARELLEETGHVTDPGALVGPIARRHVRHGYTDVVVEQDEVFFGLRVAPFDVDVAGHTEEERLTMTEHRWWSRDELAATTETVWPVALLELWARLDDRTDDRLDLGTQEESTVPVGPARDRTGPDDPATPGGGL
jgi:8-oxo-dGTP pyrophosphatase MutT (NUDIX family)